MSLFKFCVSAFTTYPNFCKYNQSFQKLSYPQPLYTIGVDNRTRTGI